MAQTRGTAVDELVAYAEHQHGAVKLKLVAIATYLAPATLANDSMAHFVYKQLPTHVQRKLPNAAAAIVQSFPDFMLP